jgi:hypothetical protein
VLPDALPLITAALTSQLAAQFTFAAAFRYPYDALDLDDSGAALRVKKSAAFGDCGLHLDRPPCIAITQRDEAQGVILASGDILTDAIGSADVKADVPTSALLHPNGAGAGRQILNRSGSRFLHISDDICGDKLHGLAGSELCDGLLAGPVAKGVKEKLFDVGELLRRTFERAVLRNDSEALPKKGGAWILLGGNLGDDDRNLYLVVHAATASRGFRPVSSATRTST